MENNENKPAAAVGTRRDFIKKTSTLAAAVATSSLFKTPVYGQSQAPSPGRVIGANDRISIAVIGIGVGIGQNHLENIHKNESANNVVTAAACDLFNKRRDLSKQVGGLNDSDIYSDYRKILDRKDIDSVLIATHDPWHAQITMDAIQAGKHVYCEKPMTRYLGEAFEVYDTVKGAKGLVYQIGSQGTSAGGWKKCNELITAGKIGQLVWAQGFYCRNSIHGEWNDAPFNLDPDSTALTVEWDTWLGKNQKIPFSNERFHRWRKFYPYCAGVFGDLAPHRLHPLMLAAGPEFPVRVTSIGTHSVHADKDATDGAEERQIAEHQQLLAEFPSGALITLTCSTVNAKSPGFVLYGHKATLNVAEGGNRIDLVPERDWSDEIDPQTFEGMQQEDIRMHEKNFFDSIRNGQAPNGNVDLAIRVQTVLSLAEMSNRLNIMCLFDEKTRTITDGSGKKIEPITYGSMGPA